MPAPDFPLAYPIVAVCDLQTIADRYARIGFAVGAERRVVAGLVQRTVAFAGNAIVLMALDPTSKVRRRDRLHRIVAEHLALREGVPLVALRGTDRDIEDLRARDVEVVRRVLPDAANPGLSFTITDVLEEPAATHPNSAMRVLRVTYGAAAPERVRPRFRAIWRRTAAHPHGFDVQTASGTLRVLSSEATAMHFLTAGLPDGWTASPGVVAITVITEFPHQLASRLHREQVPFSVYPRRIRIDADFAGGVVLEFVYPAVLPNF